MESAQLKEIFLSKGFKLAGIARELGVNKSAVTRWTQSRIPAERVSEIEKITGVPREVLRPDLWPVEAAE
jgi:DNA-binding transcriptional regulator YdaS (Cro superfamily)